MPRANRHDQPAEPKALLEAEAEMAESLRLLAARKPDATLATATARHFLVTFIGISLLLAAVVLVIS
jgi:hypothetical protein